MNNNTAISVYPQDGIDDFPVLKAFQQYIDAEQAKARKRLVLLGIFFGVLTGAIIAVFVVLLLNVSMRNQTLNDRLVEYAMKERDRAALPQPAAQDNAAVAALSAKLDELQRKLDRERAKAELEAALAAERRKFDEERARIAAKAAAEPSPADKEIARLKKQLADQRREAEERAKMLRERELEEYRRKHYPELYGLPSATPKMPAKTSRIDLDDDDDDAPLPGDGDAIDYFKDAPKKPAASAASKPAAAQETKPAPKPAPKPKVVNGKKTTFRIPND